MHSLLIYLIQIFIEYHLPNLLKIFYLIFGKYVANNNANGPYIYCGFRPAFILIKNTSATANWEITDTTRDTGNAATKHLWLNLNSAEGDSDAYDILSNGFKLRSTGYARNRDTATYIFAAFAEVPFKYANAR